MNKEIMRARVLAEPDCDIEAGVPMNAPREKMTPEDVERLVVRAVTEGQHEDARQLLSAIRSLCKERDLALSDARTMHNCWDAACSDNAALQARVEAAERDAARWKHTADEQSANVTFLREKERQANALLEQEMNDIDRLIVGLGLLVEEGRTEGGFLNVPRIITKVSEMRVDAAIAERISAAIAKEQPR